MLEHFGRPVMPKVVQGLVAYSHPPRTNFGRQKWSALPKEVPPSNHFWLPKSIPQIIFNAKSCPGDSSQIFLPSVFYQCCHTLF